MSTHILIGLKNVEARGTFHGTEGVEGFSMDATRMGIIKQGTEDELKQYVVDVREKAKKSVEKWSNIQDTLEHSNMSEEEYDKEYDEYSKNTNILRYDTLLIISAIVL